MVAWPMAAACRARGMTSRSGLGTARASASARSSTLTGWPGQARREDDRRVEWHVVAGPVEAVPGSAGQLDDHLAAARGGEQDLGEPEPVAEGGLVERRRPERQTPR